MSLTQLNEYREQRDVRGLWLSMVHEAFGYLPEEQLYMLKIVKAKGIADGLLTVEVQHSETLDWIDRYCPLINAYLSRWHLRLCVDYKPSMEGEGESEELREIWLNVSPLLKETQGNG